MKASELQPEPALTGCKTTPEANEPDEPPSSGSCLSKPVKNSITRSVVSQRSRDFLHRFFPSATEQDWCNWQWQLKNAFTTVSSLEHVLSLSENELHAWAVMPEILPLRITPYYASLLSTTDCQHALRRTMVPVWDEHLTCPGEQNDPLAEEHHQVAPHLVHRYPDRVLLLSTGFCAAYCRYCTRSRLVGSSMGSPTTQGWHDALEYIRKHSQIRDVLISGGDPLTLPDNHLEYLLSNLRSIPHVEIIRIGTKVPMVLPQRITPSLVKLFRRFHPLFLSIHATHPEELTPEVMQALARLADAGIPLGSQTVLLKGINDEVSVMRQLMHGLLMNRVRPYYLYQCDPISGSAHFRTQVKKGLEIIEGLRGHTSGYAVPHFVIDAPGGGGKIPLLPDYVQAYEHDRVVLRNYEGKRFYYPEK